MYEMLIIFKWVLEIYLFFQPGVWKYTFLVTLSLNPWNYRGNFFFFFFTKWKIRKKKILKKKNNWIQFYLYFFKFAPKVGYMFLWKILSLNYKCVVSCLHEISMEKQ